MFVRIGDPCSFSTAIAILGRAHAFYLSSIQSGSDSFAQIYRTIIDALEKIGSLVVRKLKLGDDLFAETRGTNEDCDFAYVLPRRCGKFKSVLHRFVWITLLRNVHTQQRVHKIMKLNLVSAYVKKYILIIFK